jgi:hypothetical protein
MRRFLHMATPRTGKNKVHSSPTPKTTQAKKKIFVERLAGGDAPGTAAKRADIARSTAYEWKKSDAAFAAAWEDAVATALDELESELYGIAKDDDDNVPARVNAIMHTLRYRRKEVYGSTDVATQHHSDFILNITLEEHSKRLERLGLPAPVIDGDCIEEDDLVPIDAKRT